MEKLTLSLNFRYPNSITIWFFLFVFSFIYNVSAQVQFVENPSDQDLIQSFQGENVTITNASLISGNRDTQIALFENGIEGASLEIDSGIYFSTGDLNIELPNINSDNNSSISNNFTYEDDDLLLIEENAIFDVVLFEFEIELSSTSNSLEFSYQFGSEEYPDYVGSIYNDVFAIFIEGPGINGVQNIARIPTSDNPTAVNFVNGGVLGAFSTEGVETDLTQTAIYINNGHTNNGALNPSNQPGPFIIHTEFNGITKLIQSEIFDLFPGEVYQIKIALADTADPIYDSGVFFNAIQANSVQLDATFLKEGVYLGNSERAEPNDEVVYAFEIINEGDLDIANFSFEDEFFGSIEVEELNNIIIPPGESYSFELSYFINQSEINEAALYNIANISYESGNFQNTVSSIDPTSLDEENFFYDPSCPDCTVVLLPQQPQISLIKKAQLTQNSSNIVVGDEVLYTFEIKNTGNVDLFNIQIFDDLPGLELTGNSIDLLVNEESTGQFLGSYFVSLSDFEQRRIENQARVVGFTLLNEEVSDLSDFEFFTEDRPTILEIPPCELKIYNTITPNNDNVNDVFFIEGIECFPDNQVQIFNRWGVEVYSEKSYDNEDVSFKGKSNASANYNADAGLPSGVYFYILQYTNDENESEVRKGTLYIKQEN